MTESNDDHYQRAVAFAEYRAASEAAQSHELRAGLVVAVDAVLIFKMDPRVRSER